MIVRNNNTMEPRYVIILDFSTGELIKIRLSDEELKQSEEYESFEEFLTILEDKYDFRMKDCLYMTTHSLCERAFL